jgi:hypothetical protein
MKSVVFAVGILAASAAVAGGSWSSASRPSIPSAGRTASVGAPTGALQSFADQASFDAAVGNPGALASEDFDGGATAPGGLGNCTEPVNSASNDACFAPGDLVAGFSLTSTSGAGIVALGSGFLGANQTSTVVGAVTFADSTIVTFDTPVGAVSADYYGGLGVDEVTVEAFDASSNSLGTATVQAPASDTPAFLGLISSATPIASLVITAANDDGELIDNLRFGDVSTGSSDAIFADGFDGAGQTAPSVAKAFAPANVPTGTNSTLTITLTNPNAAAATLTADLVDTFPAGLVVATPADAATTCTGTATATDGGSTVTLGSGAEIPAAGSCTVTVSVTAATAGTYTNTIPAGALETDAGNSGADATADLTVADAGSCEPVQLLQDPGFEATDSSALPYTNPFWDSTSTNFGTSFCDEFTCGTGGGTAGVHGGTYWVWLGGAQAPETSTLSQSVVIPAGETRFLNFWLWIGAIGDGSTNMDVSVDATVVTSFPEPAAAEAGYTQRGVDVSSFADGNSHTITFTYTDANATGSNYSLDDVTIDCTPAPATRSLPRIVPITGSTARTH